MGCDVPASANKKSPESFRRIATEVIDKKAAEAPRKRVPHVVHKKAPEAALKQANADRSLLRRELDKDDWLLGGP